MSKSFSKIFATTTAILVAATIPAANANGDGADVGVANIEKHDLNHNLRRDSDCCFHRTASVTAAAADVRAARVLQHEDAALTPGSEVADFKEALLLELSTLESELETVNDADGANGFFECVRSSLAAHRYYV